MSSKSSTPSPFSAMGETFELMQKMWGGMGMPTPGNLASMAGLPQQMPSMLAPTVDVGELDKRIADLRAVAQWLELNASVLRTTIQTLEVQRATIATLKGITGAMLAPMMGVPESTRESAPRVPPELKTGLVSAAEAPPDPSRPTARPARKRRPAGSTAPSLAEDALNPAAWWQTLQDQFARVAATATESPAEPKPPARGKKRRRTES